MTRIPLVALLVLAACDGPDTSGQDSSIDAAPEAADTTPEEPDAVDVPEDTSCGPDGEPCTARATTCHADPCSAPFSPDCVAGHLVDGTGAPVACQGVVACAAGACYPALSYEDGFFAVSLAVTDLHHLALYFPGFEHHSPFCRYDDLCDGEVHLCDPFVLRAAPTGGTPVPDFQETLESDIRIEADDTAAVVLPEGSTLKFPFGAFSPSDPQWLALTRYPLDEDVPCFVDPADPPLALYVATPYDTLVIDPADWVDPTLVPAGLDLPNETSLPAGTVLDVHVLGGIHPDPAGLAEGEWAPLATATVTPDGTRIRTAPDEGIGYLTWFGLYPRP